MFMILRKLINAQLNINQILNENPFIYYISQLHGKQNKILNCIYSLIHYIRLLIFDFVKNP